MDQLKTALTSRMPLTGAVAPVAFNPLRMGMPALDSIQSATRTVSKGVQTFRVIRTTEIDAYETSPSAVALTAMLRAKGPIAAANLEAVLAAKPTGDNFKGTARIAAKTSLANASIEDFGDLQDLIESLTADDTMIDRSPRIGTGATSNRVSEEKRNVRVRAFLYAASRENDNDFHLIIGRDPEASNELYMTMEISGLPPKTSKSFSKLKAPAMPSRRSSARSCQASAMIFMTRRFPSRSKARCSST